MKKDVPLSELLKNEKVVRQTITREQVYKYLVNLAFDKAYGDIEWCARQGNQRHTLSSFDKFPIKKEYYQSMIEKSCDLYSIYCDTEYGTYYYLVVPQIYLTDKKSGFVGSKTTVSITPFGQRFINDLKNRFSEEGIALDFVPFVDTIEGHKEVPIGVPFPTPRAYGGIVSATYFIRYGLKS